MSITLILVSDIPFKEGKCLYTGKQYKIQYDIPKQIAVFYCLLLQVFSSGKYARFKKRNVSSGQNSPHPGNKSSFGSVCS